MGAGVGAEVEDQGGDELGLQLIHQVWRKDALREASGGDGGHGIDLDVVLVSLQLEGVHQADQSHLGCAVVGLAKVAEQPGCRGRHDDATVSLLAHGDEGWAGDVVGAVQVHSQHGVPHVRRHLGEALVAQDARVVDEDVEATKVVEGSLDDALTAVGGGDGVVVGHGDATSLDDFVDDGVGGSCGSTGAVRCTAEVVDDDLGAASGEFDSVDATQAAACPGDDGYLTVKANLFRFVLLGCADQGHGLPEVAGKAPLLVSQVFAEDHPDPLAYFEIRQLAVGKVGHESAATLELDHTINGWRVV